MSPQISSGQLSNMELSLEARIERWVKGQDRWVSGGEIERIVAENTNYKPSNASRRCRELVEDGTLIAKHEKGTVYYKYSGEKESIINNMPEAIRVFDAL